MNSASFSFAPLLVAGLLALLPGGAAAAEEECVPRHFSARPEATAGPTRVAVALFIIDISEIDDRHQTFTAEVYFRARWHDPRLARPGEDAVCSFALGRIWDPRLRLINQQQVQKRLGDFISVDAAGNASYEQRFAGVFTSAGDVSSFPFDSRHLAISMAASGFSATDLKLEIDASVTGRRDVLSVANWRISEAMADVADVAVLPNVSFTRARIAVEAQRMAPYYIWSALVPLMMIVFMSWGVFWINPASLGPQIGLAATSMLTLIAYRFTLANVLPPVAYLTRMDILVVTLSALVLLAFFEAIAVGALAERGQVGMKRALRIQTAARIAFPIALAAALGAFFAP